MYKLYYQKHFLSEHADFEAARIAACNAYFEYRSMEWPGDGLPPGFIVSCQGITIDFEETAATGSDGVLW